MQCFPPLTISSYQWQLNVDLGRDVHNGYWWDDKQPLQHSTGHNPNSPMWLKANLKCVRNTYSLISHFHRHYFLSVKRKFCCYHDLRIISQWFQFSQIWDVWAAWLCHNYHNSWWPFCLGQTGIQMRFNKRSWRLYLSISIATLQLPVFLLV
jgi:hypothetical protein